MESASRTSGEGMSRAPARRANEYRWLASDDNCFAHIQPDSPIRAGMTRQVIFIGSPLMYPLQIQGKQLPPSSASSWHLSCIIFWRGSKLPNARKAKGVSQQPNLDSKGKDGH